MSKSDRDIGIIMCDVDGLKIINDLLGHHAGDGLLKAAAEAISFDDKKIISARIGGDEFALLVWDATEDNLNTLIKDITAKVESYRSNKEALPLYISLGYCLGKGYSVDDILRKADDAMYQDKNTNRMKVRNGLWGILIYAKIYIDQFIGYGGKNKVISNINGEAFLFK